MSIPSNIVLVRSYILSNLDSNISLNSKISATKMPKTVNPLTNTQAKQAKPKTKDTTYLMATGSYQKSGHEDYY